MSIDRRDIAQQVVDGQHGQLNGIWPIIIDPSTIVPNGLAVNQEVEININPCDHIWLPTYFDVSLGLMPYQYPLGPLIYTAYNQGIPYTDYAGDRQPPAFGLNLFDVTTDANAPDQQQLAPIFALRFNSISAPWLLWGLGNMLSVYLRTEQLTQCGQGDLMRSISGVISRLWYKLVRPGQALYLNPIDPGDDPYITNDLSVSRVVLLSSLGMNQQSIGFNQSVDVAGAYFNPAAYGFSGGGYSTETLNTLERLELERKGFPHYQNR